VNSYHFRYNSTILALCDVPAPISILFPLVGTIISSSNNTFMFIGLLIHGLYSIYAALYSPTYRKRYDDFLKIDFPKVPLPSDLEKFKNLSELGKELVELHLLTHPSLSETEIGFPVSGLNTVEKVRYDEENRRVYFNKEQYFSGVSKAVWEYRIGAYQVAEKYLKDRKKLKLPLEEIEHYRKMAKAIEGTIEVKEEVEEVYGKAI
jgi:hypothetical protein